MKALPYKNERQKVSVSVEKKDSVTGEKLEGVIFGLYAAEDILSNQGEVLVEKDTLRKRKQQMQRKHLLSTVIFHMENTMSKRKSEKLDIFQMRKYGM